MSLRNFGHWVKKNVSLLLRDGDEFYEFLHALHQNAAAVHHTTCLSILWWFVKHHWAAGNLLAWKEGWVVIHWCETYIWIILHWNNSHTLWWILKRETKWRTWNVPELPVACYAVTKNKKQHDWALLTFKITDLFLQQNNEVPANYTID